MGTGWDGSSECANHQGLGNALIEGSSSPRSRGEIYYGVPHRASITVGPRLFSQHRAAQPFGWRVRITVIASGRTLCSNRRLIPSVRLHSERPLILWLCVPEYLLDPDT
jgi:hypothetical protein